MIDHKHTDLEVEALYAKALDVENDPQMKQTPGEASAAFMD